MLHRGVLIKILFGLILVYNIGLSSTISTLSGDMASAVNAINSKVSSVMGEYKSLNNEIKEQNNTNKDLYSQRLENLKVMLNKNKEIEVYLKYLNFEYEKNRALESKRKKNQNALILVDGE